MSTNNSIVASYANHRLAEADIKKLKKAGFDIKKLFIVGRDQHSIEGASMVGEFSALDAALYSCIPKENILDYESELKVGRFILVAHGTTDEIAQVKRIIDSTHPESWEGSVESSVYYGCTD